ncbi:MAG: hypothetical protein K0Q51_1445 [Rickettsiaceae bacterium]|jgi:hypothetical protein|nr:hypothetical protein [Rickettsiaceae bacterium]
MDKEYEFEFSVEKNLKLKKERGISFEEIIALIDNGSLIDIVEHPNKEQYPDQKFYIIDVSGYVYLVPFVRNKEKIFLKTIFPSRKATKEYLKSKEEENL